MAGLLSACSFGDIWEGEPKPKLSVDDFDEVAWQAAATAACRCMQAEGADSDEKCWADFNARWADLEELNYPPEMERMADSAFASAPVAAIPRCMEFNDGRACILEYYEYVVTDDMPKLCTDAEAQSVEDAYKQAQEAAIEAGLDSPESDLKAHEAAYIRVMEYQSNK
ncbi:MAG: hypothetical protein H6918_07395 [Sphingomonadaceae bacterium]|nr:hypothetical protein [Sphingomonadaceae bacterium]